MTTNENTRTSIGWPLELTVFTCGALVMIFEITGSRIVAPFLGTSTYIWTSLIGVILAALSIGYWLGGRIADRHPKISVLAATIFAAGGLVSITVIAGEIILAAISSLPVGLGVRAVLASTVLFAPASVLFGFVLPFAVKLRITSLTESGATVGRLYALSTIGSIAGTFAAGFVLIPFVGSVRTLYLITATLFLLASILAPFAISRISIGAIILFAVSIATTESLRAFKFATNRFVDIDTEYSRIALFESTETGSGRPIRAIANDPYFLQSAIYLDGDGLVFKYLRFFDIARAFAPNINKSLMIGGAGYSFPQEYLRTFPEATIDVVEIDPKMTAIAREYFRLSDDARLTTHHADARVFMRSVLEKQYDVVYMDAFGTLFSVPTHLTTVEFFNNVERSMNNDGILVMNLGGSLDGDGSMFFRSQVATLQRVFTNVRVFKVDPQKADDAMQNLVIVAGKQLEPANSYGDAKLEAMLKQEVFHRESQNVQILTDDLAPVEYYNSIAQRKFVDGRGN